MKKILLSLVCAFFCLTNGMAQKYQDYSFSEQMVITTQVNKELPQAGSPQASQQLIRDSQANMFDFFWLQNLTITGPNGTALNLGEVELKPVTITKGEDGLYYVYSAEDDILRTDKLIIYNVKMNKVLQIVQEIGRQPVLSFGNSSGDMSMHNYTIYNNPYKSMAFMLIADDEERDYGYEPYTQMLGEQWEAYGYNTISIREDFLTIYGEDVVRTGVFNWLSILSDDRD